MKGSVKHFFVRLVSVVCMMAALAAVLVLQKKKQEAINKHRHHK